MSNAGKYLAAALLLAAFLAPARGHAQDAAPQPESVEVYDADSVQVKPRIMNRSQLAMELERRFPPGLRNLGIGGGATVRMVVDETGRPTHFHIVKREGSSEFGDAVLAVARTMRFRPAEHQGRRVRVRLEIPISFEPQR